MPYIQEAKCRILILKSPPQKKNKRCKLSVVFMEHPNIYIYILNPFLRSSVFMSPSSRDLQSQVLIHGQTNNNIKKEVAGIWEPIRI